jgi:hypothetical protein
LKKNPLKFASEEALSDSLTKVEAELPKGFNAKKGEGEVQFVKGKSAD